MIIPFFKSHYSICKSILTLESSGSENPLAPDSVYDICKESSINELFLVEDNMSGFLKAYETSQKEKINLHFGLRLTILNDLNVKDEDSLKKESKIIIFIKKTEGYKRLIKIYSKAATDGFYYIPRIDWKTLKELWHPSLLLCIPFYDSFLFNNFINFESNSVPDLFVKPFFCLEEHELPFDPIITNIVKNYCANNSFETIKTHMIYYKNNKDAKAYMTMRAIHNRNSFHKPELQHFASDKFSFEYWSKINV